MIIQLSCSIAICNGINCVMSENLCKYSSYFYALCSITGMTVYWRSEHHQQSHRWTVIGKSLVISSNETASKTLDLLVSERHLACNFLQMDQFYSSDAEVLLVQYLEERETRANVWTTIIQCCGLKFCRLPCIMAKFRDILEVNGMWLFLLFDCKQRKKLILRRKESSVIQDNNILRVHRHTIDWTGQNFP